MNFRDLYKSGKKIEVDFEKKDGTMRHMICERDAEMESQVRGVVKSKTEDVVRVVEITESGEKQWRSVPLNRIVKFSEV